MTREVKYTNILNEFIPTHSPNMVVVALIDDSILRGHFDKNGFENEEHLTQNQKLMLVQEQNLEKKSNTEFQINLNRSKLKFRVEANESIIDSLRKNNFFIESSCEEGYCGTCLTRYLGGEPDHRDTVLDEKERKNFILICCSRSNSPELVLDL